MYFHTDTKAFYTLVTFSTDFRDCVSGINPQYYCCFIEPAFVYCRGSGERLSIYSFSTDALYFYWCFKYLLPFQLSMMRFLIQLFSLQKTHCHIPWSGEGWVLYFSRYCIFVVSTVVVFSTIYHNTFNISQYSEASICLFPSRGENC